MILQRQRLLDDLEAIESGEDPKAIIRDPAMNQSRSAAGGGAQAIWWTD